MFFFAYLLQPGGLSGTVTRVAGVCDWNHREDLQVNRSGRQRSVTATSRQLSPTTESAAYLRLLEEIPEHLERLGLCFIKNAVAFEQQQLHVSEQCQADLAVLGLLQFGQRFPKLPNDRFKFIFPHNDRLSEHETEAG